jgi:signal transduction histidine kinase
MVPTAALDGLLGDEHPLVSDADSARSLRACVGWLRTSAGGTRASVRVALPDLDGRLRVVATEGRQVAAGRLRSSRRRQVFESGRPLRVELPRPAATSLEIFPLVSDGESLGVVEVVGPTEIMEERDEMLLAIIGQSAVVLRGATLRAETERTLRATSAMLRLASDLLGADTATRAVRMAVDACHAHFGMPVVGLLPDRDGWGWFLAASRGFGSRKRAEIRRVFSDLREGSPNTRAEISTLSEQFGLLVRSNEIHPVVAREAVLFLVGPHRRDGEFLVTAGNLLAEALRNVAPARSVSAREADLGIAWAAHELKGPITAAAAAISHASGASPNVMGALLERTREELRQSAELIDPLLRWSSGRAPLRFRGADLVEVARDAIASCTFEGDAERVRLEASARCPVWVDPGQLRVAISNLVRNALRYSPAGSPVTVAISEKGGTASICVRDRGPGVPASERRRIFDPLRSPTGQGMREGSGLGLFLARRIVEAHRGRIEVQPVRRGASFCIQLPPATERRDRSLP